MGANRLPGRGIAGPPASDEEAGYQEADWASCDGFYEAEIGVSPVDGPWPAMVKFEISYGQMVVGGTLTEDDARNLGAFFEAAAIQAAYLNSEARRGR